MSQLLEIQVLEEVNFWKKESTKTQIEDRNSLIQLISQLAKMLQLMDIPSRY